MKTIEQKAKAYDEALERARNYHKQLLDEDNPEWAGDIEKIFPELKESEEDRIRKEITELIMKPTWQTEKEFNRRKELAVWLEKQGEIDKESYEIAEKEKYNFVSGHFIECRKSFNEFKEDNSYWLEYIGDDNYIGRSDNVLNQKFHITPRQLFTLFTVEHCPKNDENDEDKENEDDRIRKELIDNLKDGAEGYRVDGSSEDFTRWITWLEKQGSDFRYPTTYDKAETSITTMEAMQKQGKEKAINDTDEDIVEAVKDTSILDMLEPNFNFKVGQWIVATGKRVYLITKIDGFNVTLVDVDGNEYVFDTSSLEDAHLWTIQDAKLGDVLFQDLMDGKTFIYNGVNSDEAILYSFIISNDGKDVLPYHIGRPNTGIGNIQDNKNIIRPATKEQRDTLLKAMADAGWGWDAEEKELEKIEQKFKIGDWIVWQGKCYKVNYNGCGYELIDQNGLSTSLEYGTVDTSARLWTIQDAKDGDVLVSQYSKPFIYNGNCDSFHVGSYCGISVNDRFNVAIEKCHWTENVSIHPATKEQRDTLLKAMADAGWGWDAEEKELKVTDFGKHLKYDPDAPSITEQKTAWSEVDELSLKQAIYVCHQNGYTAVENWLKSLKDRYTWKPSDEQLDALHDAAVYVDKSMFPYPKGILIKLYKQIKKLKEE